MEKDKRGAFEDIIKEIEELQKQVGHLVESEALNHQGEKIKSVTTHCIEFYEKQKMELEEFVYIMLSNIKGCILHEISPYKDE